MGNCKNCKLWGASRGPIIGFDPGTKKHCGRFAYELNDVSSLAYLEDGDYASSNGSLWTEPDFGCALFEAKEGT